jgi:hypothetical protein
MYRLDVLQAEQILIALGAGLVLTLALTLGYRMMWGPRASEDPAAEPATGWRSVLDYTPWLLVLLYAGILAYGIVATVATYLNPPNY